MSQKIETQIQENSPEGQAIMQANIDRTIHTADGTERKPRSVASYEWNFLFPATPSFGLSIFESVMNAFSNVFEYTGLPEEIKVEEMEMFIQQSGRIKMIKAGQKYYPVRIVPKHFNNYGDFVKSTIVEPYLPGLSGKDTEKFKNVEFKNDVRGNSLIRKVHPFIEAIDDALFNLQNNQALLAGRFVWVTGAAQGKGRTGSGKENEDSLSKWMINGKPVKELSVSLLQNGALPIHRIEANDHTQSFIETVQFNYNQMLNVLGIPNNNVEGKKERLITSEVAIQNVLQSSILEGMLKMRERAIEECNKVFGWNATVEVRKEIDFDQQEDMIAGGTDNAE